MIKIVTHDGGFHADEVFAVAALQLHLGVENVEIIRTREQSVIDSADWVVDVGGVYDANNLRFDHHQNGAPVRDNGVPYAAFGLVWKHIGEALSGSAEVAAQIEEKLVLSIDADDVGMSVYTLTEHNVKPVTLSGVVALYCPPRDSNEDVDEAFRKVVVIARELIEISIKKTKLKEEMKMLVEKQYSATEDKRVIVFDKPVSVSLLIDYPDTLLMINPSNLEMKSWSVVAVPVKKGSFETRISFPEKWLGLRDEELAEATGVADAIFCHKSGYMFKVGSREGALEVARKCLDLG
jgi:uncharacterized UPF0160 family protein